MRTEAFTPKVVPINRKEKGSINDSTKQNGNSDVSVPKIERISGAEREKREKIILDNLPLVKSVAWRIWEELPSHAVDLNDLIQEGVLGLQEASEKFDQNKKVLFSTYASRRIKGAILDYLRGLDWVSRNDRKLKKKVDAAIRDLGQELQRSPLGDEVSKKMGMNPDKYDRIRATSNATPISVTAIEDTIPSTEEGPDKILIYEKLRTILDEAIKTLPPRYQEAIRLHYYEEMTLLETGNILGVNESRASQICNRALEKLYDHLGQKGIASCAHFGLEVLLRDTNHKSSTHFNRKEKEA
jgi:RNA polymerase sigma factor FliA